MNKTAKKTAFKQAMGGTPAISALIPTGPQITEAQLKKLILQKKAEGLGKAGRPPRKDKDNSTASAAERGTLPGEMRKTYLVSKDHAEAVERIAYWQRSTVKDAVAAALKAYIAGYEKKNGPIKPIPGK